MCTYVYQESVAEEEKATEILDQKIRDLERDIAQQRKHMGGFVTMTPFKQINIIGVFLTTTTGQGVALKRKKIAL